MSESRFGDEDPPDPAEDLEATPGSAADGGFLRAVGKVLLGAVSRHGLLVISAPVLSRLYSPTDFGLLALLTALLGFVQPASGLRYELGIPVAENEDDAEVLLWLSVAITAVVALGLAVVVAVAGSAISSLLNSPDLAGFLWLLPILLLAAGTYEALTYLAVRRRAYGVIAATKVTQGIGNAGVGIGLGLLHVTPLGLLLSDLAGRSGGMLRLLRWARQSRRHIWRPPPPADLRRLASRFQRFPKFSVAVGLVSRVSLEILPLFLSSVYETAVAGLYLLAARVIEQPLKVLGNSVSQVYLGEASSLLRRSPEELRGLFLDVLRKLTLLAVVPFAVLLAFGDSLFAFVFGAEWREAGRLAQAAAPMFALQFVTSPLSQTLTVLERQDVQLWFSVVRLVLVGMVLGGVAILDTSPFVGVLSYSILTAVAYLVYAFLGFWQLREHARSGGAGPSVQPQVG